jgi:hypothetical protein
MGERNVYRILVGNPDGKSPLGRPTRRWVDNIKMDFREIGWDGLDWIDLYQDRNQWRALVNTAMNIWIVAGSQEGLNSVSECEDQKMKRGEQ